jgi:uncharacterized protein YdaU (DUF1376 family)
MHTSRLHNVEYEPKPVPIKPPTVVDPRKRREIDDMPMARDTSAARRDAIPAIVNSMYEEDIDEINKKIELEEKLKEKQDKKTKKSKMNFL